MMRKDARGKPPLRHSAVTPMYVKISVVATMEESMLATHGFESVP
jgi:hypothetical protein